MQQDMSTPDPRTNLGIALGLGAAIIWGAWPVVTSIGVKSEITPVQVVMLRFLVAGILLSPFAFRRSSTLRDWGKAAVFALFAGTPYALLVTSAFEYAPASHGGVIIPGTVMLVSLVAAHLWLGDKLTRLRGFGAAMILIGLGALAGGASGGPDILLGDLLLMAGGVSWASYTFLLRRWPMDGLTVASRVAFLSLLLVGGLALAGYGEGLTAVPLKTLALQGLWQGILSAIVALLMFNRAVGILGSSRASILNALTPVIAVLLSFLILNEVPTSLEFAGLVTIMAGIAIAIGIRIKPMRRKRADAHVPDTP
jgi:drug/metabolite transporter (DMT)-like permease